MKNEKSLYRSKTGENPCNRRDFKVQYVVYAADEEKNGMHTKNALQYD